VGESKGKGERRNKRKSRLGLGYSRGKTTSSQSYLSSILLLRGPNWEREGPLWLLQTGRRGDSTMDYFELVLSSVVGPSLGEGQASGVKKQPEEKNLDVGKNRKNSGLLRADRGWRLLGVLRERSPARILGDRASEIRGCMPSTLGKKPFGKASEKNHFHTLTERSRRAGAEKSQGQGRTTLR